MTSFLLLGFLLGVRHAFEADHIAAVATLSTGRRNWRATALGGAAWGLGHTLSLLVACGAWLLLGVTIGEAQARALEAGVGGMLVILGLDVLRRMRRDRLHVHLHQHDDGIVHIHAHRHACDEPHDAGHHRHPHRAPARALLVGMVHGLAGSATVMLLVAATVGSSWLGLTYVGAFGLGSIGGMLALSMVIVIPLEMSARRIGRVHTAVQGTTATATMALGLWMVYSRI